MPAYSDAVRVAGAAVPSRSGTEVVLHSQEGSGANSTILSCGPSDGGLHFHLHVENGDKPSLAAGWQARGASSELASFLAELGVFEYHDAGGCMASEVGPCMVIEPGTVGSATSLVSERAVAFVRLADSMAARVDLCAHNLRPRKSVSWADIKGVAPNIAAAVTVAKPLALFSDSAGKDGRSSCSPRARAAVC